MSELRQAATLYEDWQSRRDRLAARALTPGDRNQSELRLLDFLLEHYRGSPEATRPARFPARTEVYVNRRAIVVFNHLGKGYMPDVHTRCEAEARVRGVLERMATPAERQAADRPLFNPQLAPTYDENLETIRGRLCNGTPNVRMQSAFELGRFGSLDDIGLISDLLALPHESNEDPYEGHVLLAAMKQIVARHAATGPLLP